VKEAKPTPVIIDAFVSSFIIHVHSLLAWGVDAAQTKIRAESHEEHITGYIAEAIKNRLMLQPPKWTKYYDVHNEDPIPSDTHPGKERNPIDLLIVQVTGEGRPEFVFEAKQLNSTKKHQRVGNYTGPEAMQRFLSGEYADYTARFPAVGMLGYVLSDSVAKWHDWLTADIEKKRAVLSLQRPQQDVNIVDTFPQEWISEHSRSSALRSITMYHILILCVADSTPMRDTYRP